MANDASAAAQCFYVDSQTYQLRCGSREDARRNLSEPFGYFLDRLKFQGWEGFCAVEEEQSSSWTVYFDVDDNALRGRVPDGRRVLEIEVKRSDVAGDKQQRDDRVDSVLGMPPGLYLQEPEHVPEGPSSLYSQDDDPAPREEPQEPGGDQQQQLPSEDRPDLPGCSQTIVRVHPPVIESVTRLQRKRRPRVVPQHQQVPTERSKPRAPVRRAPAPRAPIHQPQHDLQPSESFERFVHDFSFTRPISVHLDFPAENVWGPKKAKEDGMVKAMLKKFSVPFTRGKTSGEPKAEEKKAMEEKRQKEGKRLKKEARVASEKRLADERRVTEDRRLKEERRMADERRIAEARRKPDERRERRKRQPPVDAVHPAPEER